MRDRRELFGAFSTTAAAAVTDITTAIATTVATAAAAAATSATTAAATAAVRIPYRYQYLQALAIPCTPTRAAVGVRQ